MKIAHIANTFPPYWSGTGLAVLNLATSLARRNHEVHVYTTQPGNVGRPVHPNLTVHRQFRLFEIGKAPFAPGLLRLGRDSLIHLHYPYYFGAELVMLRSIQSRTPVVITYHNDVVRAGIVGKIIGLHSRFVAPTILRHASRVCVMSEQFAADSHLLASLPGEKVRIVPQGVDTSRFHPGASVNGLRGRLKIAPDTPLFLFVRSLDQAHHHSGLDVLLQAMKRMSQEAHLLVVGDGELRIEYEQLAENLELQKSVHFVGALNNEELPGYYASSSVFVLPSTETENASLALLEAMACNIPVVASGIGGTKAMVRDGIDGLLVPANNALSLAHVLDLLASNRELAQGMGAAAGEKVRASASWDVIAGKMETIYEEARCESP